MGLDRALNALSQSEAPAAKAGTARSGRSPQRSDTGFARSIDPRPRADLGRPGADLERQLIAQLGHEPAGALRRVPGAGPRRRTESAIAASGPVPGRREQGRAAARRPRRSARSATALNGSHKPGGTPAQVQLVAELVAGAPLGRRPHPPRRHPGLRRPLPRPVAGDMRSPTPCSSVLADPDPVVAHAGDQGVVAMVVLASRTSA